MRDMSDDGDVRRLLILCAGDTTGDLAGCLHPDFQAFGVEDGMYISADRQTYVTFMTRIVRGGFPKAKVEWIDVRNRIATGCLCQEDENVRRTIILTLLYGETGWQVMTATFVAEEPVATSGPPTRLQ